MARVRYVTIGLVAVGVACVALLIVLAGMIFAYVTADDTSESTAPRQTASADRGLDYYAQWQQSSIISFSGKITQLGTACTIEAQCGMIVDGKSVIYAAGVADTGQTGGRSTNMRFVRGGPKVGQTVQVKARVYEGGTYSIINCAECYIEDISTDGEG